MLQRLFMALSYAVLGVIATTQIAHAAFDPSRDELAIGTFLVALAVMVFFTIVRALISFFGGGKPEEVEIPDHAHDHRYAGHH